MVRYRIEIWNQTNTERLAVFVDPLQAVRHRRLKGEETLSLAVPLDDPASEYLTQGNVLRLQRLGSAVDFSLWRVADDAQERGGNAEGVRSIEAYALWMDFRHGLVRQPQVGGRYLATFGLVGLTPTQLLTDFVLPGYQGTSVSFQLGTVDPAIDLPLSLNFERVSPLAALRMIEEAAADGAGAEAQFRVLPDGSGYFVDLLERVGVAAGGAELRYRKNIRAMRRTADERNIETLLFAYGSGLLSLADARWRIASAVGGVITFDGPSPVFEDDAFVGLWWYVDGKAAYPITASDAGAGTLTVDTTSLPALAGGDIGWIATDALGAPLDHLVSPLGVSEYDIRVGTLVAEDVPDARNLLQNGDFSEWTGGVPDHWSLIGSPVVTESTEPRYVQQGGAVAHVVADADEGLVSDAVAITQDETRPYHGMLAGLTIISGRVRMELRHSNGKVYPIQQQPKNEGVGVYITLSANAHSEPLPAGTAQLAIVAHGGPAEFALDCAMITPQLAADVPAFVSGDGAQVLWQRAALELGKRRRPRLEYQVDIIDLYAIDPDAFVFEEIELGDDVTVRDPIARETQRVVEISEDLLTAEATSVVLAPSVRERVEDPHRPALPSISGGIGTGGGRGPEPATGPRIQHFVAFYDRDTNEIAIQVLANARTATIALRMKYSPADDYPDAADALINDRQGTFSNILAQLFVFRLTALDGAGVPGESVEGSIEHLLPDLISILRFSPVHNTFGGAQVTYRCYVGPLVAQVWITRARFEQLAGSIVADPYGYAEKNSLNLQVFTDFLDDGEGGRYFDVVFGRPPEGFVDYVNARPYYVRPNGQFAWGHAREVDVQPLIKIQPIVDSDDHEDAFNAMLWVQTFVRGLAVEAVRFGTDVAGTINSDQAPTRTQGDMSAVTGKVMGEGEYEFQVAKSPAYDTWIWADVYIEGGARTRVGPIQFGPNPQPFIVFESTRAIGTLVYYVATKALSVKIERIDGGGTWEINRDGSPSPIDVSEADDDENPGLSTGNAEYRITVYSDTLANRNPNTLTWSDTVFVRSAPTGGERIQIMTPSPPAIDDSVASILLKATTGSAKVTTRMRYRIDADDWGAWVAQGSASPDPAPTAATSYPLTGLPTRRLLTGQIDPPQYLVNVEVECTLTNGELYDKQTRGFAYTTNAEDV